jgi:hypothetical protein
MLFRVSASNFALQLLVGTILLWFLAPTPILAQQSLGSIIGHTRVLRGGAPPQAVLVDLQVRGASIASVYTDAQGTFGFHEITPDSYTVVINDDHYQPVEQVVVLEATTLSPQAFVEITLKPKPGSGTSASLPQPKGTNPNLTDARQFSKVREKMPSSTTRRRSRSPPTITPHTIISAPNI